MLVVVFIHKEYIRIFNAKQDPNAVRLQNHRAEDASQKMV